MSLGAAQQTTEAPGELQGMAGNAWPEAPPRQLCERAPRWQAHTKGPKSATTMMSEASAPRGVTVPVVKRGVLQRFGSEIKLLTSNKRTPPSALRASHSLSRPSPESPGPGGEPVCPKKSSLQREQAPQLSPGSPSGAAPPERPTGDLACPPPTQEGPSHVPGPSTRPLN